MLQDSLLIRILFGSPAKRSVAALVAMVLVLLLLGYLYVEATNSSNLKRIEQFKQQVGAETAAELWAKSVRNRDPKFFVLKDHSKVEKSDPFQSLVDSQDDEQQVGLTVEQRLQVLSDVRTADPFSPPVVIDFESQFHLSHLFIALISNWDFPEDDTTVPVDGELERWLHGVEITESIFGGAGPLVQELIRHRGLSGFLASSTRWLSLGEEESLHRILTALNRIEPPGESFARVIRIEMLMALALIEKHLLGEPAELPSFPYLFVFDLEYFFDHNVKWSLDPYDPDNLILVAEEPPFYAPVTKMLWFNSEVLFNRVNVLDSQLKATIGAFEAMLARLRGQEWIPGEGIELLEDSTGKSRIHVIGGSAGTDLYLPE